MSNLANIIKTQVPTDSDLSKPYKGEPLSIVQNNLVSNPELDYFGIIGSVICFIHCLAMPFILPYFNYLFGSPDSDNHAVFHFLIFPVLLILAGTSIGKGYRKHHNKIPVAFASIGLFLMGSTLIAELFEIHFQQLSLLFNILGSTCLILAHSINLSHTFSKRVSSNCTHIKCTCKNK